MTDLIPPLRVKLEKCPECRNGYIGRRKCVRCQGKGYAIYSRPSLIVTTQDRQARQRNTGTRTAQQRREDGHCTDCGNPNLETKTRCHDCAERHRRRNRFSL